MGIDYFEATSLLEARQRGVSFARTLTIAHQRLNLHPVELRALRGSFQSRLPPGAGQPLSHYRFGEYSDRFLREMLDVRHLEVLDNSPYEGATFIHDLNDPVPESRWGQFDAVLDGGSLEHVFNVPVALANVMRMTKVGGLVFLSVPANNLCGHGFYQFSPELMFRVFSADNGFEVRRVVLLEATYPGVELTPKRGGYQVSDPAHVRSRVGLLSERPVMMAVEATKIADVTPFDRAPQQSDYVELWSHGSQARAGGLTRIAKPIVGRLPTRLRARLIGRHQRSRHSFVNRRFFEKL